MRPKNLLGFYVELLGEKRQGKVAGNPGRRFAATSANLRSITEYMFGFQQKSRLEVLLAIPAGPLHVWIQQELYITVFAMVMLCR